MYDKNILAKNLQYYMDKNKISRQDLCKALDFKYSTLSEWLQGKKTPRMDKVEKIAQYFNIPKSYLIEEITKDIEVKNTEISNIVHLLRIDPDFFDLCNQISKLSQEQKKALTHMLTVLDDTQNKV